VKGGELFDKIVELGGFDEVEAARVFKELIKVMNYTHSENIMHRDLKPENVLLDIVDSKTGKYTIKVIDWGTGESYKNG
jgi:serine/threonine protein kinase